MSTLAIPSLADVTAAWHGLPAETRDRIGIAVVDMVFQGFLHGDAYVATDQLEDLPVYDEDIRAAAFEAEDARLNELHRSIEAALPDLFGKDENPPWCENPGTTPSPVARAWAAKERAEIAARRARLTVDETDTGIPEIDSPVADRSDRHASRDASRDGVTAQETA